METQYIINRLQANCNVFKELFQNIEDDEFMWKPALDRWSLLEIISHLYDEEREDFRSRVKQTLENPSLPWPPINPLEWVIDRKYMEQDYTAKLESFLQERQQSVNWLQSLVAPKWDNAYHHPKVGLVRADFILTNWLAHDYLHIKQITKVKYDYLKYVSGQSLDYAGEWN